MIELYIIQVGMASAAGNCWTIFLGKSPGTELFGFLAFTILAWTSDTDKEGIISSEGFVATGCSIGT